MTFGAYDNELLAAVDSGDANRVADLLDKGADVNAKDNDSLTPLHLAAINDHLNVVEKLIKRGADVNAKNNNGYVPLHLAAINDHLNVVEKLIEKGADVNAKDNFNYTPLHLAASYGHLNVVEKLTEKGADVNAKDNFNYTPLHLAASYGHLNVVEKLIEKGADVNLKNNNKGFTPLHEAAISGYLNVVKKLIEKGAKVYDKNNYGLTPLELANNKNNAEIVNLFVCYKDKHHYTLLHHAAKDNNANLVDLLLDRGADVNAKDNDSLTPLYLAAINDHLNVVEKLIEKGADINAKNNNGDTPLHWAARNNNSEVAEFFMSKHADVNTKNKDDWTPLHFASACGNLNVVDLILDKRDDVDAIGALTVANTLSKENSSEIVSLLEERIRKNEGITQHLNSQEEGSSLSIGVHNHLSIAKEDEDSLQNDEIDSNKIEVTSSATRTSLWINDLFSWVKSSMSGLFYSRAASFEEILNTTNAISQVDEKMDVNGTIMLLDVLVRKVTGQKYISTVDQSISPLEGQGYALNITEGFEKVLNETAIKSGISVTNLNFDPVAVQSAIVGQIVSEKLSGIPKILYSFAKKACPEFKQTDKFLAHLKSNLEEVLAKEEAMLLQQKVGHLAKTSEVSSIPRRVAVKELPKKPDTFLNGTSVVKGISNVLER